MSTMKTLHVEEGGERYIVTQENGLDVFAVQVPDHVTVRTHNNQVYGVRFRPCSHTWKSLLDEARRLLGQEPDHIHVVAELESDDSDDEYDDFIVLHGGVDGDDVIIEQNDPESLDTICRWDSVSFDLWHERT